MSKAVKAHGGDRAIVLRWQEHKSRNALRYLAKDLQGFRSMNPIESIFDKAKTRGRRVKNWKADNQLARWSASALLLHEKKFRRIKGYRQLPKMISELENLAVDKNKMIAQMNGDPSKQRFSEHLPTLHFVNNLT